MSVSISRTKDAVWFLRRMARRWPFWTYDGGTKKNLDHLTLVRTPHRTGRDSLPFFLFSYFEFTTNSTVSLLSIDMVLLLRLINFGLGGLRWYLR